MNEYAPINPVGQIPGADRAPSVTELVEVEHMRLMTAVGQAFVDSASLAMPVPQLKGVPSELRDDTVANRIAWRLVSGNMSPEAQSIAYESARQSAIAAGTDPNEIKYPVGKNALTLDQALDISSRYTITQLPNDPTGFSGTVLKEIPTRIQQDSGRPLEVVVALRDTEFRPNSLGGNHDQDMTGADLGELMTTGASFGQIAQADAFVNNIVRPLLADGETVRFASGSLSGHISQAVQLLNPDIVDTSTPWSNVAFNPTNLPRLFDTSGQLTEGQILRMAVDTYVEVRDNPASVQSWLPQHGVQDESQLLANTRLLDNAIHAPTANPNADTSPAVEYYDNPRTLLALQAVTAQFDGYGLRPSILNNTDPASSSTVTDRPGNLSVIGSAMTGMDIIMVPSIGTGTANVLFVPIEGQNAVVTGGAYTDMGNNHSFYNFARPVTLLEALQQMRESAGLPPLSVGEFMAMAQRTGTQTSQPITRSSTAEGTTEGDSYSKLLDMAREALTPADTAFVATTGMGSSAYAQADAQSTATWFANLKDLKDRFNAAALSGNPPSIIDIASMTSEQRVAAAMEDSPTGEAVRLAFRQGSPIAVVATDSSGAPLRIADSASGVPSEQDIRAQNNAYELIIQGREQNLPGSQYDYHPGAGQTADDVAAPVPPSPDGRTTTLTDDQISQISEGVGLPAAPPPGDASSLTIAAATPGIQTDAGLITGLGSFQLPPQQQPPADPPAPPVGPDLSHTNNDDFRRAEITAGNQEEVDAANAANAAALQASQTTAAITLLNTLLSLNHWDDMGDLQRASALVAAYNVAATQSNGALEGLPPSLAAGLGFLAALESGNDGAILSSGLQLLDAATSTAAIAATATTAATAGTVGVVSQTLGTNFIPGLNLALAISSGNPVSMLASAVAFIPGWGQVAALVINFASNIFGDDDIPAQVGWSTLALDASGQLTSEVTHNDEGGGAPAAQAMQSLLGGFGSVIAQMKDEQGNALFALNPARMPQVGYLLDPDGVQYDAGSGTASGGASLMLSWVDDNGQSVTRYYDANGNRADGTGENISQDFATHAQQALVPAWMLEQVRPGYVALMAQAGALDGQVAALQAQADAIAPHEIRVGEGQDMQVAQQPSTDPALYAALQQQIAALQTEARQTRQQAQQTLSDLPTLGELGQQAVVNADGTHQSIKVLTLTMPDVQLNAAAAASTSTQTTSTAPREVLINLDGDAWLERTPWVAANQALLGLDLNGDGRLGASELLTDDLGWLDANSDSRIDAHDPAFSAIRLWTDLNGDGQSLKIKVDADGHPLLDAQGRPQYESEAVALASAGITAIDFSGGQVSVIRADGSTSQLDSQTLMGDTLGVMFTQATDGAVGVVQSTEQADGTGLSVLVASNTRAYDGQADHTHGGDATTVEQDTDVDAGDTRLASVTHKTVEGSAIQTLTTVAQGDARIGEGDEGQMLAGQDGAAQTQGAALAGQVVGDAAVAAASAHDISRDTAAPKAPRETAVVDALASDVVRTNAKAAALAPEPAAVETQVHGEVLSGQPAGAQSQAAAQVNGDGQGGKALAGQTAGQTAGNPGTNANADAEHAGQIHSNNAQFGEQSDAAQASAPQPAQIEADDARVSSTGETAEQRELRERQTRNARSASAQPIVFVPAAQTGGTQSLRDITADMVRSAEPELFSTSTLPLMAMALGAAGAPFAAQAASPAGADALERAVAGVATSVPTDDPARWNSSTTPDSASLTFQRESDEANAPMAPPAARFRRVDLGSLSPLTPTASDRGDTDNSNNSTSSADTPSAPYTVRLLTNSAQALADADAARPGAAGSAAFNGAPDAAASHAGDASTGQPDGAGASGIAGPSHGGTVDPDDDAYDAGESGDALAPSPHGELRLQGREDTSVLIDAATLTGDAGFTLTAVGGATHGQVSLQTVPDSHGGTRQQVVFIPDADYFGPAAFSYTLTGREGQPRTATATLLFEPVNDAPDARGEQLTSFEGEALLFTPGVLLANDTDRDGDALHIAAVGEAEHGSVFIDSLGNLRFVPEPGYTGAARFSYWVADPDGAPTQATVRLTIIHGNDAPVVLGETVDANEDDTLSFDPAVLLANDHDNDGPLALSISAVGLASHGSVALVDQPDGSQRVVFTPEPNYFGVAGFTYTVSDGGGGTALATVLITLAEVNDVPVAADDALAAVEDTALRIPVARLLANDTDADTTDVVAIGEVGNAVHGTVALQTDPGSGEVSVVFTPDADYSGPASFTYTADDGRGGLASALVTLDVAAVNDAPVVAGETIAGNEDQPLLIAPAALLANDLDIDNPHAELRISAVGSARHGAVALDADGNIAFTPEADYVGTASFEYTVDDGSGGQTVAVASIELANVNDAPVLQGETVDGLEDTSLIIDAAALLANDTDPDIPHSQQHSDLRIVSVGGATHGQVALNADGSIRFTPAPDYNASQGAATFEYTVSDGAGGQTTGVATLNIAAVNDAPVTLGEIIATVAEDTVLSFTPASLLANDTDVDNPHADLHVAAVGNASHGSVTLAADGAILFTPDADHVGAASFSYTVGDGAGGASQATVTMGFSAVNDAPRPVDDTVAAVEDMPLVIAGASLLANDVDVDSPHTSLQVTAVGDAVHGTVALGAGGQVTFTPDADFNGEARFSYTVSDDAGGASTAIARVQVAAVNDAPQAHDDTLATQQEDTNLLITAAALLANDTDVDVATNAQVLRIASVSAIAGQTHGSVALDAAGNVLYSPDANYAGPVGFAYTVQDDAGASSQASVQFEICNVNDAPVVLGEMLSAKDQPALLIDPARLLANDSDPDAPYTADVLRITGVGNAQHGHVQLQEDGAVLFTPDAGFVGVAQFDYTVGDGLGGSSSATAEVHTSNIAPAVLGETVTLSEDTVTTVAASLLLANDTDADNAHTDLRIVGVGNASHGQVTLDASGNVVFAPELNYNGAAAFSYTVADGDGGESTALATVNVLAVNDAPVVTGETASFLEDQVAVFSTASLLANDTDIETPGSLSISAVGNASGGTVSLSGGQVVFAPHLNYYGAASFTYNVSDGAGCVSQGTVSMSFSPVNDAPVVNNETLNGLQDTPYTFSQSALLANDTDAENPGQLVITSVSGAQYGSVSLGANGVQFVPQPGFFGTAAFNYTVQDPQGAVGYGVTYLNLAHVNHNPVAVDDSFHGSEDLPLQIPLAQLLVNDSDADTATAGDVLSVSSVHGAVNGAASLGNGYVSFVPNPEYSGLAGFYYDVSDGKGGSASAIAYVTVHAVNDAPVIDGVYYDPTPDSPGIYSTGGGSDGGFEYQIRDIPGRQNGTVHAHDIDSPGPLAFSIAQGPTHGHASIDGAGNWLYTSEAVDNYRGADPFYVRVADSGGASSLVAVTGQHDFTVPLEVAGSGGGGGGGGGGESGGPGNGSEPIVIDLGNDGLHLIAPEASTMRLDTNGDGVTEQIGWAAPEEAVLAWDANHSGTVDALAEVRFTGYLPGARTDLEGLRAFDSNGDGVLDAADDKWGDFGLLQTPTGATALEQGQFTPIAQTGITGLDLNRQGEPTVNNGNIVFGTTTVSMADGTTLQAADVRFLVAPDAAPDAAQQALVFNAWCAAACAPPDTEPPLAFVPLSTDPISVVADPAGPMAEAANSASMNPAPHAALG